LSLKKGLMKKIEDKDDKKIRILIDKMPDVINGLKTKLSVMKNAKAMTKVFVKAPK